MHAPISEYGVYCNICSLSVFSSVPSVFQVAVGFSRQWYGWQHIDWQDITTQEDTSVAGDPNDPHGLKILTKFSSEFHSYSMYIM